MHPFCVVLRQQHLLNSLHPRMKRYYLQAKSAAQAMLIASSDDIEWLVFGVEPACMSAHPPQSERSESTTNSNRRLGDSASVGSRRTPVAATKTEYTHRLERGA
jgi:hypothetical protein